MPRNFSAVTRQENLAALAAEPVDLLIIGGGITGAGAARDAAMRGIRTALVDAGDFAHGTSSRSSRLIHGGLRYLEHGWLSLVFEASRERRTLLRIAPHLVRPRAFTFPVHAAGRVGRWQIAAGLWLYDLLALFRNVHTHRLLSRRGVLQVEPMLRDQDLMGGAIYYDAQCDDSRLVLANIRSAHRHGARVANYARVRALEKAGGRLRGAVLEDVMTGARLTIRAHVLVNATGPWSDAVRRLDDPDARSLLRPTKGAHIAVPRSRVGNTGAVTLTSPIDGRVMFVLPWGDVTVVGTTDTDADPFPDDVYADEEDVAYLLRSVNAVFPNARVQRCDVIAAWAALRPLLAAGSSTTGAVPREHRVVESASGLITIAGGKLTTYRAMAAELVDLVARRLRRLDGRPRPRRAPTDREPLPGGEVADFGQLASELMKEGVPEPVADHLVATYGAEAPAVANLIARDPGLGEPLVEGWPWVRAEVVYQARREMAMTVSDVMIRRTHLFQRHPSQAADAAPLVAGLLARALDWDAGREAASLAEYLAEVRRMRSTLMAPPVL
ncbi:MAG: glycerol-3-phosphate dehydrogenase/oxidase [Gemmatimonadetes bacterium]|nr:glycerol-3-phosphate dehydrogenase/oxidase [Gemmatimonadota bacterium]